MTDLLLEHPRALAEKVAGVLDGRTVSGADLPRFVSSAGDPFLNHLFAPSGRPVYARASYRAQRALPVLRFPAPRVAVRAGV